LLFGSVTHSFDKFGPIEQKMADDLDNWLCNLYFEIERVNLMDLQVDEKEDRLFFSPVNQLHRKIGHGKAEAGLASERSSENHDIYPRRPGSRGGSKSESATSSGTGSDEDKDTAEYMESVDDSGDEGGRRAGRGRHDMVGGEEGAWEHVIHVDASKTAKEMDYDQYKFAVGIKYDLRTKNLTFKKIKYIMDEILADLRLSKWKTLNF